MCAHQFSMMMNKINQSRRENVKVDINLEMHTYYSFNICAYLNEAGGLLMVILTSVTETRNVISIGLAPYL